MGFDGQVFIVTGAAGNVGSALVRHLVARGARVVGVDQRGELLEPARLGVADATRYAALPVADLADTAAATAMAAAAEARFGRIDGLAQTVGGFAMAPIADQDDAMWSAMLRMNVITTASAFRAVLPALRRDGRGSLVAIGAIAALGAPAEMAAYAAAKSAVLRLVESTAQELKPTGIRANAVLPGTIDTPQNRAAMPDADPSRWVTPAQVAAAMGFLLSDDAAGVTGALLPVTGRS
ncbi:MAG: SDR family oxidoreductase [Acetobacteraceae bacterium]|nr:SDR family oxidoreductase [Acetobacteraceae bacterium]